MDIKIEDTAVTITAADGTVKVFTLPVTPTQIVEVKAGDIVEVKGV